MNTMRILPLKTSFLRERIADGSVDRTLFFPRESIYRDGINIDDHFFLDENNRLQMHYLLEFEKLDAPYLIPALRNYQNGILTRNNNRILRQFVRDYQFLCFNDSPGGIEIYCADDPIYIPVGESSFYMESNSSSGIRITSNFALGTNTDLSIQTSATSILRTTTRRSSSLDSFTINSVLKPVLKDILGQDITSPSFSHFYPKHGGYSPHYHMIYGNSKPDLWRSIDNHNFLKERGFLPHQIYASRKVVESSTFYDNVFYVLKTLNDSFHAFFGF